MKQGANQKPSPISESSENLPSCEKWDIEEAPEEGAVFHVIRDVRIGNDEWFGAMVYEASTREETNKYIREHGEKLPSWERWSVEVVNPPHP